MEIYDLLKTGKTVTVRNPFNGKTFSIQPEYRSNVVKGYSVIEDGKPVPGYHRKLLDANMHPFLFDSLEIIEANEEQSDDSQ